MVDVFGPNIYIISNSRREWEIDWKSEELKNTIAKNATFVRLDTKYKKPFNSDELLKYLE